MMESMKKLILIMVFFTTFAGMMSLGDGTSQAAHPGSAVHVDVANTCPGNGTAANPFCLIQDGINHADEGDIVKVAQGTYNENVVINGRTDLVLRGQNAILQGSGELDTAGIGISIVGSDYITVQGFIVEAYQVGIVLDDTHNARIHNVETRFNDSNMTSQQDGLQLISSSHNLITNVNAHDNGHNGITLKLESTHNTLRGNTTNDNGQNPDRAERFAGCGIQLLGGGNGDNDNNTMIANEALRNGWGIQVGSTNTGNEVLQSRTHENDRAGVAVIENGNGNFLAQNNATGNGLADQGPSFAFDLFDGGDLDNTWKNNQGSANFL